MLIALPIGHPLGAAPAVAARPSIDDFVLIGISAHPVWIGLIFAYFFGYKLGWTPITGYCDVINPPSGATAAVPCSGRTT